jgi:hypothetical protein
MRTREMKTKILVLLCVPFILSACASPEEPEVLLHIEGTVTNTIDETPIEGAIIELLENFENYVITQTWTNREGRYALYYTTKCIRCDYTLVASIYGFLFSGRKEAKRIKVISQIQTVDFQL